MTFTLFPWVGTRFCIAVYTLSVASWAHAWLLKIGGLMLPSESYMEATTQHIGRIALAPSTNKLVWFYWDFNCLTWVIFFNFHNFFPLIHFFVYDPVGFQCIWGYPAWRHRNRNQAQQNVFHGLFWLVSTQTLINVVWNERRKDALPLHTWLETIIKLCNTKLLKKC